MKKMLYIILILFLGVFSCDKVNKEDLTFLSGKYIETYPQKRRCELEFIDNENLKKIEQGSSREQVYNYEISGNIIRLKSTDSNSVTRSMSFKLIDDTKFEIEDLYSTSSEGAKSYMTFEKWVK